MGLPPGMSAHRRVCIQGFCLQGLCIGGGGAGWVDPLGLPLESEKRMVCIQVECFLVFQDVYTRIFSQTHGVGNIGTIANFVCSHICSFVLISNI